MKFRNLVSITHICYVMVDHDVYHWRTLKNYMSEDSIKIWHYSSSVTYLVQMLYDFDLNQPLMFMIIFHTFAFYFRHKSFDHLNLPKFQLVKIMWLIFKNL